jgi:hypothetical protein
MRHPYTQALFRSIPLPGADKNARPLIAIPGNFPLPHERPPGCNFGPRCDYFVEGPLRRAGHADGPVPGGTATKAAACASTRSTGRPAARQARRSSKTPGRAGSCCEMEDLKKYYEVSTGLSAAARRRWSRPTKPSASRRARARRWPSWANRLRQVHLRQGADGAGDRDLGQDHARLTKRPVGARRSRSATPTPCRRCRWCSRTPSTR